MATASGSIPGWRTHIGVQTVRAPAALARVSMTESGDYNLGVAIKTLTEEKKFKFLTALRECKSVTEAAKIADINRRTLYDIRDRDIEFRNVWIAAIEEGADRIQDEVRARALDKSDPKSATLLIFLLKGLRPQFKENFRDKPIQIEHVKEWKFNEKEMDEALKILQNAKKEVLPEQEHHRLPLQNDSKDSV